MEGHTHITQHPEFNIAIVLADNSVLGISSAGRPHRRFKSTEEASEFLGRLTPYDERPDKKKDDGWGAKVRFEGVSLARIVKLSEEFYAGDTTEPAPAVLAARAAGTPEAEPPKKTTKRAAKKKATKRPSRRAAAEG